MNDRNAAGAPAIDTSRPHLLTRRTWLGVAALGVTGVLASSMVLRRFGIAGAGTASAQEITVYKSPTCGCCEQWIKHVEDHGFTVRMEDLANMEPIKRRYAVPPQLWSCHTSVVGGYTVEGHVPADLIQKLLAEKTPVAGIAVPGMPQGAPGMEQGQEKVRYEVLTFTRDGEVETYAVR